VGVVEMPAGQAFFARLCAETMACCSAGCALLPQLRHQVRWALSAAAVGRLCGGGTRRPFVSVRREHRQAHLLSRLRAAVQQGAGYQAPPPAAYQYAAPPYQYAQAAPVRSASVSLAWWLLPVFLGVLGGVIAFFGVFKRNMGMAVAMLLVGVVLSVVSAILVINALSNITIGF
jgi:hypothetical protein